MLIYEVRIQHFVGFALIMKNPPPLQPHRGLQKQVFLGRKEPKPNSPFYKDHAVSLHKHKVTRNIFFFFLIKTLLSFPNPTQLSIVQKMANTQLKPVAYLLLLLNFCMYAIVLGIGAWAMNRALNHGFIIGNVIFSHFHSFYYISQICHNGIILSTYQ